MPDLTGEWPHDITCRTCITTQVWRDASRGRAFLALEHTAGSVINVRVEFVCISFANGGYGSILFQRQTGLPAVISFSNLVFWRM